MFALTAAFHSLLKGRTARIVITISSRLLFEYNVKFNLLVVEIIRHLPFLFGLFIKVRNKTPGGRNRKGKSPEPGSRKPKTTKFPKFYLDLLEKYAYQGHLLDRAMLVIDGQSDLIRKHLGDSRTTESGIILNTERREMSWN